MKKLIASLLTVAATLTMTAQNFEGKITYANTWKSKSFMMNDKKLTSLMGDKQEYIVKDGNYKSTPNGTWIQWTMYINKDNKIYSKLLNNETIYFSDAKESEDVILDIKLNKGVTEILGHKCDELVLTCKSGVQKYYFSDDVKVDSKQYINHKFGNWYDVMRMSNAWPLKMIIENDKSSMESVATEIKEMPLDAKLFEIPADAVIKKSPK